MFDWIPIATLIEKVLQMWDAGRLQAHGFEAAGWCTWK